MSRLFSAVCLMGMSLIAQAEPQVLTSIKPLQLIAAAVQDGLGQPQVLLPAGASAHHYSLRPSDLQRLTQADLFYWIGPNLETFLVEVTNARPQPSLAVQTLDGLQLRYFAQSPSNETEQDADADHRPGALDAHLWLSSHNARRIAQRMADDLAHQDPKHQEQYQHNAKAFSQRLDQLDQQLRQQLAPLAQKPFFVFHEAYDYFEERYGLRHQGAFHLTEENTAGARHIALLRQRLQAAGPCCVLYEPPLQPRLAQTLGSGLPVTLSAWDDLGVTIPADSRGYEALLTQLATQLSQCLTSH